jgi:hypothetical protein
MSYYTQQERKRRLKKLYNETKNSCKAGAYYDEDRDMFIKFSPRRKSKYAKYLRKVSNRKVRRYSKDLKYGSYRKVYDYWWELF